MQVTISKAAIQYALLTMLFCYLPHFISNPWWLSIAVVAILGYRSLADKFSYPLPNALMRLLLMGLGIFFLFLQYRVLVASGFYIGFLLLFVALKTLEIHSLRDLRVIALCNFYIILTALIVYQTLWIFFYIIFAVLINLSLLLKITAPNFHFRSNGKTLLKHFLLAIPIGFILFYIFPRFSPLWQVPTLSQTKTGFSEEMTVGNVAEVFNDDSIVMWIIFKRYFKPTLYWRGLVLSNFNGWSWKPESSSQPFTELKPIGAGEQVSYEIMLEPHQKKWLFYQDNPIAAYPTLSFSANEGLIQQNGKAIYQRFSYSLIDKPALYKPLTTSDYQKNTYLPPYGNPRLRAWSKQQFAAVNNNVPALIKVIAQHIYQNPYWYSLRPGKTGIRANLMDEFWFETQRGYCEYYAGAVTIILRAVGIPARVIVGYHGGHWNPVAQYLTVQQNDAHAWLEYWQEGQGWQRLDPVSFIAENHIDPAIEQKQSEDFSQGWLHTNMNINISWLTRANYLLESAQFFWERWLLFYNQDTQRELLEKIGLGVWDAMTLLQAFILTLLFLFVIAIGLYLHKETKDRDKLLFEYGRLQQEMQRLGIKTQPPATFTQQLDELSKKHPSLKALFDNYKKQYEQLRLRSLYTEEVSRKLTFQLIKSVRLKLKTLSNR